jgi:pimeloyl-ACP methyl ester carboxylesterase
MTTEIINLPLYNNNIDLEYRWIAAARGGDPLMVFLHEGLGSVSTWREYPQQLCEAGSYRGLAYSRYGYGQSTPRREPFPPDYLDREAREGLPAFLQAVGARAEKPWFFGHSDGASIALLYAARFPDRVAGVIALAPHIFIEDVTIAGLSQARAAYQTGDLKARLARHHADTDSAFWGWNDTWLNPATRSWNIEYMLPTVTCPVLAIQGFEDEYATMAQLDQIKRFVPQTDLLKLTSCGHAPHRDQARVVTMAVVDFIAHS